MPKVMDPKLYAEVRAEAKKRFLVWPSAYASGWLVREYKRRGGRYADEAEKKKTRPLADWYKEKWVDTCRLPEVVPCGRSKADFQDYPYCRPTVRVSKATPVLASELTPEEIRARCDRKKKSPRRRVHPAESISKKIG